MIWEIGTLLKHVMLPPLGLGWLLVLAWFLVRKRPRTARWLIGIALSSGLLLATPMVSSRIMGAALADQPMPAGAQPGAIVVLGNGRGLMLDAQGHVVYAYPSAGTLERMLAGARLHKRTGLPLLVTGGNPDGRGSPEAGVMRDSLERDFGVPVRWVEDRSRNTVENALNSAPLLRAAGIGTIYLVTHDYHMHRARQLFEAQGFKVFPIGAQQPVDGNTATAVAGPAPFSLRDLVPTTTGLNDSFLAFNEMAGLLYSRARARAAE